LAASTAPNRVAEQAVGSPTDHESTIDNPTAMTAEHDRLTVESAAAGQGLQNHHA
jgi:hypothetical protein